MSIEQDLHARSGSTCELCTSTEDLQVYIAAPKSGEDAEECLLACGVCRVQLDDPAAVDPNHWRCLNDSMWSPVPAVQVVAWRMLDQLRGEGWPVDLLDMLYLDEETLTWAQSREEKVIHLDAHGTQLQAGDSVTLTQSLDVKGANFTAKRGTAVRNISLVHDNPEHIEGRVNGQKIVILTKYVKKST